MRQHLFLLLLVVAPASVAAASAALPGCGTVVVAAQTEGTGGRAAASSSTTGFGGVGGSGGSVASSSTGYVDPGCPDAGPPGMMFSCDPFAQDCPSGEGCYIFTQNPSDPCGQEVYGAACESAGSGTQGTSCDSAECAPGFACVVSGAGNQCVELCQLQGAMGCPDGLVCQPIDVEGFGGCL